MGSGVWGTRGRAFTLLQFIAVLAIIALLAAALLPGWIRQIDRVVWEREVVVLDEIMAGLKRGCLEGRRIPAAADMPALVSANTAMSLVQVQRNARRFNRVFLLDPDHELGLDIHGNAVTIESAGWVQTAAGVSPAPTDLRVLVLSTVATALPTVDEDDFDGIWDTPEGQIPAALASWGGRVDDLLIRRLNLGAFFYRVQLLNVDVGNDGYYAIDYAVPNYIPGRTDDTVGPNVGEGWFLEGTQLRLYRPGSSGPVMDSVELMHEDTSYVYQRERWRRRMTSPDYELDDFGEWVSRFLEPPAPTDPKFAATQRAVVGSFFDYLWGYARWAYGSTNIAYPFVPQFDGANTSSTPQYPSYTQVLNAQVDLDTFTSNLIE